MGASLWPLCRLILLLTPFWIILTSSTFIKDGNADYIKNISLNVCATHIARHEKHHNMPTGLMQAISKVESGRKDDTGRIVAWPWTVNANGQGYYFPTKEAAIQAVKAMQKKGIKSIDVGCMQVNLYYHPNAFKNLAEAFDPHKNVAYAARFLTNLKNEHKCWRKAIAHYHSANPIHYIPYQRSVLTAWHRDYNIGNIALAAAIFTNGNSGLTSSEINHIRRLVSAKTLKLKKSWGQKEHLTPASQKTIRRVTRFTSPSSHIRRVSSHPRKTTKKIR